MTGIISTLPPPSPPPLSFHFLLLSTLFPSGHPPHFSPSLSRTSRFVFIPFLAVRARACSDCASLAPFDGTLCPLCPSKVSSPRSTLGSLTLLYFTPVAVLTHTLCPLCPSKRSLSTQGPASAPLALCSCTACTWIPFAILSLVSGPLPDRVGHLLAVLASQPTARSSRPAAPAPPRRCRSTSCRCLSHASCVVLPPLSQHSFASPSRTH